MVNNRSVYSDKLIIFVYWELGTGQNYYSTVNNSEITTVIMVLNTLV